MSHTPGSISFHYEEEVDWGRLPCPPLKTTLYVMMTKDRHNALMAQRTDLLLALKAWLSFDWDTLLAAAGGEPYSPDYDWSTVLAMTRDIVEAEEDE